MQPSQQYENTDDADDDTDYFEFTSTILISGLDEIQLVPEQAKEANRCLAQLNFHLNRISFFKGYFFTLLFAFCVSLSAIFIKLSKALAGSENSTVRYLVQLLIMSVIIFYRKEKTAIRKLNKVINKIGFLNNQLYVYIHFFCIFWKDKLFQNITLCTNLTMFKM